MGFEKEDCNSCIDMLAFVSCGVDVQVQGMTQLSCYLLGKLLLLTLLFQSFKHDTEEGVFDPPEHISFMMFMDTNICLELHGLLQMIVV